MKIKGYVTNLGRYNEGVLMGEWITFPVDENELKEVLKRIGIGGRYEEYFFTDYDTPISIDLGEFMSVQELNTIAEKLEQWGERHFLAAVELDNINEVLEADPSDYLLLTEVNDDKELGYHYAVECYNIENMDSFITNYFDYEKFGRDIRLNSRGTFSKYGWIERV